ncbi:MAG: hypothetical protein IPM54_01205 [Polyangiaceae bacterium]|nr:hypothetical protein [Polyangiaceae bacterium]
MNLCKFAGLWGACLALVVASGCSGSPPEVPSNVTSVSGRHDHEGNEVELVLDTGELLACLETARSIPIGKAHKCVIGDGDYTVFLNGRETVINIHDSTQFTIDHQGFFSSNCLYPMLYKAAHGKAPEPGGC